jgi:hypothetical protein
MYAVSLRFLLSAHSLHFFLPSPPATILSSLCFAEIPEQSALGSCLGRLGAGCLSGHCSSSELGSVVFWTFDIHDLSTGEGSSETFFLFVFSVLYTKKNVLSSAQFSRYNTNFFNHLTVSLKIE